MQSFVIHQRISISCSLCGICGFLPLLSEQVEASQQTISYMNIDIVFVRTLIASPQILYALFQIALCFIKHITYSITTLGLVHFFLSLTIYVVIDDWNTRCSPVDATVSIKVVLVKLYQIVVRHTTDGISLSEQSFLANGLGTIRIEADDLVGFSNQRVECCPERTCTHVWLITVVKLIVEIVPARGLESNILTHHLCIHKDGEDSIRVVTALISYHPRPHTIEEYVWILRSSRSSFFLTQICCVFRIKIVAAAGTECSQGD